MDDVLARAAALAADGTPFVLATVTWRRGPSSGKGGSKALILADGSVEGWLGGACAEPTVVRHALEAIRDGEPRLLVLGEPDSRPGVTRVAMACSSEGAMEVFVDPVLPAPDVWVIGRSPAVATLARLAEVLGWDPHVVGDDVDLSRVTASSAVVVATQGHYDEPALQAALATDAGYIGLVASAKRAAGVLAWLSAHGADEAQLARVRAPAGLDLGATSHDEIAVAILAELVARRAVPGAAGSPEVRLPEQAVDPVCGMSVDVATARFTSRYGDEVVYFCAAGCQQAYEAARGPGGGDHEDQS